MLLENLLYLALTLMVGVLSVASATLTLFNKNLIFRLRAKTHFVERLKVLNNNIQNFYKVFSPSVKADSKEDVLNAIFFLLFLFGGLLFMVVIRYSLGILGLVILIIATQSGMSEILYQVRFRYLLKIDSEFVLNPDNPKDFERPIEWSRKALRTIRNLNISYFLVTYFVFLYILFNSIGLSTYISEVYIYPLAFGIAVPTLFSLTSQYRTLYDELEFRGLKLYLENIGEKVVIDVDYEPVRNHFIQRTGKVITAGNRLYILREDGNYLDIEFRQISAFSVRNEMSNVQAKA